MPEREGISVRFISKESPDVYRALVAELSRTLIPTSMTGITFLAIGGYAFSLWGSDGLLFLTLIGGLASIAKVIVVFLQLRRSRISHEPPGWEESKNWELAHIIVTAVVSSSVGGLASLMFLATFSELHLLATVLIFGYCTGVFTRLAPRPWIASTAMTIAGVPAIICVYAVGDVSHRIVAVIFFFFLLSGIHSVIYIHRNSVRHISMRLDMEMLARNDPLTGLANRLGLREAFRRALFSAEKLAVHCLDLDGFKEVNDQYGHAAGDEVLMSVANRLNQIVPPGATVARIGGDEFVVLQKILHDESESDSLRELLRQNLRLPFALSCATVSLSGSVGTAISNMDSAELDALLRAADDKLYQSKRLRYQRRESRSGL
ncbi:GGDEF domain-containing protein [Klebsiella variicola]|nr:GGDEF domain-containing protein [Klebsiella variicola]PXK71778.1 GGDEF domain-containing protein [Klebsiella variicola]